MSHTLECSLKSVFSQIDSTYEVIVVDDGSTDNSLEILYHLQEFYPSLVVIPLHRDSRRKLGETRNVSIRAARGEYVLLHIDADDIWDPFIPAFVQVYHEISRRLGLNHFFLSGRQIQMSPRCLLLDYPYRNFYFGEDRVLWNDLLVEGKILFLNHRVFRTRIPLSSTNKKFIKMISSLYSSIFTSFSITPTPIRTLRDYFNSIIHNSPFSFFSRFYQLFILPFAFLHGAVFSRHDFINQCKWPPPPYTIIDLHKLELSTWHLYGAFKLSSQERAIFFEDLS